VVVVVVELTEPTPWVTVVVAVVVDRAPVVVVTVVVGETLLTETSIRAEVGDCRPAPVGSGACDSAVSVPPATTNAATAKANTAFRRRPVRARTEEFLPASCPWCICAPSWAPWIRGGTAGNAPLPAGATRLTQGVPWFCVPSSRRVCHFFLQVPRRFTPMPHWKGYRLRSNTAMGDEAIT